GRAPNQFLGAFRVLNTRQLDQDVLRALALDVGFGDAELIDTVADGLERLLQRRLTDTALFRLGQRQLYADDAVLSAGGLDGQVGEAFLRQIGECRACVARPEPRLDAPVLALDGVERQLRLG